MANQKCVRMAARIDPVAPMQYAGFSTSGNGKAWRLPHDFRPNSGISELVLRLKSQAGAGPMTIESRPLPSAAGCKASGSRADCGPRGGAKRDRGACCAESVSGSKIFLGKTVRSIYRRKTGRVPVVSQRRGYCFLQKAPGSGKKFSNPDSPCGENLFIHRRHRLPGRWTFHG